MSDWSYPGDLRLSIPADAVFIAVARDVAMRFAEFVGAAPNAAADLGAAVERLASHMHGRQIDFAMEPRAHRLTVRAHSGSASEEASCPLPD
jgi:hypothetical protein